MKRKSKYLGKSFNGWKCIYCGISNVQSKKNKAPGTRNYYYIFERLTSDAIAMKRIRLNSTEASNVYKGLISVEDISKKREAKNQEKQPVFTREINYNFVDWYINRKEYKNDGITVSETSVCGSGRKNRKL